MELKFALYSLQEMVRNKLGMFWLIRSRFIAYNCCTSYLIYITYVYFAALGKYVLSSGKDSLVKLWEMSTTRCLIAYTGAGATGKQVLFKTYISIRVVTRGGGSEILQVYEVYCAICYKSHQFVHFNLGELFASNL